jgi:6-pyruvoyltetrahydropterin/6-carboxytetrahydropterin synthase
VRLLWRRLTDERLAETFGNGRVHKIKLQAHRRLWVTYAGRGKTMQLTRVYEFCAAHRLRSPFLSDEENALVFGECENPYGHGHNYELHVTVAGQVDERTGLLVDVAALDRIVDEEIISRYDHKHLNHDVEEFRALNPSCENVVKVIWERLSPRLTGARLARVGLRETSKNFFEYAGESEA